MNETAPEEHYFKEVGIGGFIVGFFPLFIAAILMLFVPLTLLQTFIYVLFERKLNIIDFILNDSVIADPGLFLLIMGVLVFYFGLGVYRDMKKKPFAILTDEKFVFYFEKISLSWNQIQAVELEDNRKLTVVYEEKGKKKKRMVNLRWFPKKDDFIIGLKKRCAEKSIPFHEHELTCHSRIELWMGFGL